MQFFDKIVEVKRNFDFGKVIMRSVKDLDFKFDN